MRCNMVLSQDVEQQHHFYLEAITGEVFSKKEEFVL